MADKTTVAVLGGGHGAHAMAADLISRGFAVNFFEFERFRDNVEKLFETKTIVSSGIVEGSFQIDVATSDIAEAIDGVKYIFIPTPAFAHDSYAEALKGKVSKDQIIVLYPGAFSALMLRKALEGPDCPVICEANNLPYDARVLSPAKVSIFGLNTISIGFLPAERGPELIDDLRRFYPFERVYDDVLEAGLSIVNPAFHSGLCLLSVTAIENSSKRPFFLYEHGVTPASVKVNMKLDWERKQIGNKLGYNLRPVEDFTGLKEGYSWQELYMAIHGNISLTPISGPHDIYNRYFTEDAPYGLVPWSYIGKQIGIETPTIDCIIHMYNIIHERNWWELGRNATDLGLGSMTVEQIKHYVRTGVRA